MQAHPEHRTVECIGVSAAETLLFCTRLPTPHPSVRVIPRRAIRNALFHMESYGFQDWRSMLRRYNGNLNEDFRGQPRAAGGGHEADAEEFRVHGWRIHSHPTRAR